MNGFEFVIALVTIVLACITCWIYMLTTKKSRSRRPVEASSRYSLNELSSMADSLQDRIDTLESILDAEVPNWREQNEQPAEHASH